MATVDFDEIVDFVLLWTERLNNHFIRSGLGYKHAGESMQGANHSMLKSISDCVIKMIFESKNPSATIKVLEVLITNFEKISQDSCLPPKYMEKDVGKLFVSDNSFVKGLVEDVDRLIKRRENIAITCNQMIGEMDVGSKHAKL